MTRLPSIAVGPLTLMLLLGACSSPRPVGTTRESASRPRGSIVEVYYREERAPPYARIGTVDTVVESTDLTVWYPEDASVASAMEAARGLGGDVLVLIGRDVEEITREIFQESHIHVRVHRYRWAIGTLLDDSGPAPPAPAPLPEAAPDLVPYARDPS